MLFAYQDLHGTCEEESSVAGFFGFRRRSGRGSAGCPAPSCRASDDCSGTVLISNDAPADLAFPRGVSTVECTFDDCASPTDSRTTSSDTAAPPHTASSSSRLVTSAPGRSAR